MQVLKTLKVPIHHQTTKKKLKMLERLTARFTYAVNLFSATVARENAYTRRQIRKFSPAVAKETGLNAAYIQQCEDKALWMWKSYEATHRKWAARARKANGKKLQTLLRREPSPPDQTQKKIPIRIDRRTGEVQKASLHLTDYVLRLSTFEKFKTIILPLNPSKYHKDLLAKGQIKDFEILARKKKGNVKYFAYTLISLEVPNQPIKTLRGVDLGIRRTVATVSLPLKPANFSLIRDGKLRHLQKLNDRIAHLRRLEKWNALKTLRSKRRNYSEDQDRKTAKRFVTGYCQESRVLVGHPYLISYNHPKGNGDRRGRKILQGWAFRRMAVYIQEACTTQGISSAIVNEWWTSSRCHKCQGKVSRESRRIVCQKCGLQYDADFNACINIMIKGGNASFEPSPLGGGFTPRTPVEGISTRRGLQMNQPEVQMIRPQKPLSAQTAGPETLRALARE